MGTTFYTWIAQSSISRELIRELAPPLRLAGIVLLLLFGLFTVLVRSRVIPPLTARRGGQLLQSLLRYGFILALVSIVLGFGLLAFDTWLKSKAVHTMDQFERDYLRPAQISRIADLLQGRSIPREQHNEALSRVKEIVDAVQGEDPATRAQAENLRGIVLQAMGRPKEADGAFVAAITTDPRLVAAYVGRAAAAQAQAPYLIQSGDLMGADRVLEQGMANATAALKQDPHNAQAHTVLGYLYKDYYQRHIRTGNAAQAAEFLNRAEAHFKLALTADPKSAAAHNGMGNVHLMRGNFDQAIAESTKASELDPSFWSAFFDLTLSYYDKGRVAATREERSRAARGVLATVKTLRRLDAASPASRRFPPDWWGDIETMEKWAQAPQ